MHSGIAILGSTGSIGKSALMLLDEHPELGQIELITAHNNLPLLMDQIVRYKPRFAVITGMMPDEGDLLEARDIGCDLRYGTDDLLEFLADERIATVLLAISGAAGLRFGLEALERGKRLAIANKEPLVIAGQLFHDAAEAGGGEILPVDSEHSAIFQCLEGCSSPDNVNKIILTSSGGPFHAYSDSQFDSITPEDALNHPTWDMGRKITIDSATMMNKALEVLEARWLFSLPLEQISVSVHRQSVVHSMVEFVDGSVLAQLGVTDMRAPILHALTYPRRIDSKLPKLDFNSGLNLSFEPVNPFLNQAIQIARSCEDDPVKPILFNAANEVWVEAFLEKKTPFTGVYDMIRRVMKEGMEAGFTVDKLDSVLEIDHWAREHTWKIIDGTKV